MKALIIITLLITPAYAFRTNLFGLPMNLLMLWIILLWIIFLVILKKKNEYQKFLYFLKNADKKIWIFLLASTISLFFGGINIKNLGQYFVLFIQPISLYFIAKFIFDKYPNTKYQLLEICYFLLAASGLYAVLQYFLGFNLPLLFQGNDLEPKRAVSFFTHPNFYSLWATPLLALLIPDLALKAKSGGLKAKWLICFWLLGSFGLLLTLSRAGWIGLSAAIILYVFVAADKKSRAMFYYATLTALILILFIPSMRHRLSSPFMGEKSASSRITLWQSGIKAIKQSPIFGLGLGGYGRNYRQLISDQTLPNHNFPHNIFLNLWVETGILGLFAFIGVIGNGIYHGLRDKKNIIKLSVALFIAALLVQGQIDNPYFKNDLAVIFWLIAALI